MSAQLQLPGVVPSEAIVPDPSRAEPSFWIQRVCVLRELTESPDAVVRNVELRRGLNIVWAPSTEGTKTKLFKNGIAGHTAGKTTFCRLLRYLLGENTFANEGTRRRIRESFDQAWVVGEVFVEKDLWTVARPLGLGPRSRSFCVQGSLAQAFDTSRRLDYEKFTDALARGSLGSLSALQFPATEEAIEWEHLLPWLSRDQECRFADAFEWRNTASDSETPDLIAENRQFLVRSVLGLVSDEERAELRENARLVSARERAIRRAPILMHQAEIDHARVCSDLEADLAPPSTDLFGAQVRDKIAERRDALKAAFDLLASQDHRNELREFLEAAAGRASAARDKLTAATETLERESKRLEQLSKPGDSLLAALPPPQDYCGVPLSLAREQNCPLAFSRPVDLEDLRGERSAEEARQILEARVEAHKADVRARQEACAIADSELIDARRAFLSESTRYIEERGRLVRREVQLQQTETLSVNARNSLNEAAAIATDSKRLVEEIKLSHEKQENLRRQRRDALGSLSRTFDYVLRAVLGDEFVGRLDSSGRSLKLAVEHHGDRDSAAISTTKLLAFDLAALTEGIQGRGAFPRFLIHDGPREADLASDIYDRLFLYCRELERCFDAHPSFQYIVTTTTRPPEEVQKAPWVVLTLSGKTPENRLLGCDL